MKSGRDSGGFVSDLRNVVIAVLLPLTATATGSEPSYDTARDYHSFSNPAAISIEHADLGLQVDFTRQIFSGAVDLRVQRHASDARELILDTRDLVIREAWLVGDNGAITPTAFRLDPRDPILGSALHIDVSAQPAERFVVRVSYQTAPSATGLQWLAPEQTAGKRHRFVFSQSEAIHARSWIPLQDTPQVRMTYHARIITPPEMLAVMSAAHDTDVVRDGDYRFDMPQPIPSYLL